MDKLNAFDLTHTAISIEQLRREVHERNIYRKALQQAQGAMQAYYLLDSPTMDKHLINTLKKILLDDDELIKLMKD